MKAWDFFDSAYYEYQSKFDLLNTVEEITDGFDEVKLNMLCDEFDYYCFMKHEEWSGSFEVGEVEEAMHKLEREGEKLPMDIDSVRPPLSVNHYFKQPKIKGVFKSEEDLTEKQKKDRDQILKELWEQRLKTIDFDKLMDPHNVEFSGLYRLRNILIDLKRKHTDAVYKFEDQQKDSFNPFSKNFNSDKSDTFKFFEAVNTGELSKLDIQNKIQELTDNYDDDKLNLLSEEFDEYIFVKYENWRSSFTMQDIEERIERYNEDGIKIPLKDDEKNRCKLLYVKDFFLKTRFGKPISDEEYEKHMNELFGDERKKHDVIDDNVLLGGFYFRTESRSLMNLRDILVKLKRKHTSYVYRYDDTKVQTNSIQPLHWLKGEESLSLFIEELKSAGLIENRETEEIIQEHFRVEDKLPIKEPQPIKWLINIKYLAYLIDRLGDQFLINIKDSKHQLTASHFVNKQGNSLNVNSLSSLLSQLINHSSSKDKKLSSIEDIIQKVKS